MRFVRTPGGRVMTALDVALARAYAEITSEPALRTPPSADLVSSRSREKLKSFTSQARRQKSAAKVKPKPADAMLIIGFDTEWVTETADLPDDNDDGDCNNEADGWITPEQIPHN